MTDIQDNSDTDVFERDDAESTVEAVEGTWVQLPSANLLTTEEADGLLRWRFANLVAVIGERDAGKTTLISEIYDRFLHGPFAGNVFCNSRSLLGFEQKAYQARASSGADRPDTPRTSGRDGLSFFHLGVVAENSGTRSDLLISERAGESYRELRDTPAKAQTLIELSKARSVALILDGARVADARRRAEAFASVRNIARAIVDGGGMAFDVELQLVTTKFDLLNVEAAAPAVQALDDFEAAFQRTVAAKGIAGQAFRTAARDPTGVTVPAWGVDQLFLSWIRPRGVPALTPRPLPDMEDEFDRMALTRADAR